MYEVEIVIRRQHARPFRVPEVANEDRVKEIIESFLAAWGLPTPDSLRDTGISLFAERLAAIGRYDDVNDDHRIMVRRSGRPDPLEALMLELSQQPG